MAFTASDGNLAVVTIDGTDRRDLTVGNGYDFGAAWSPDGSHIAFVRYPLDGDRVELRIVDTVSGTEQLIDTGAFPMDSMAMDVTPEWSPDGQHLTAALWSDDGGSVVAVWDLDTWTRTDLSPAAPGDAVGAMHPTWAPDGTEIVFMSDHTGGPFILYAIRPDGNGLRQVSDGSDEVFDPAWS